MKVWPFGEGMQVLSPNYSVRLFPKGYGRERLEKRRTAIRHV